MTESAIHIVSSNGTPNSPVRSRLVLVAENGVLLESPVVHESRARPAAVTSAPPAHGSFGSPYGSVRPTGAKGPDIDFWDQRHR